MLEKLTLTNFRAFKRQSFHLKKINIFVGKNNSGKSSALSALNLLAQTMNEGELDGTPLILNGVYDQLGTFIDVVNGNHPRRKIGIGLDFDGYSMSTEFKYRTQRRQIELVNFDIKQKGKPLYKYTQRKDAYDISIMGQDYEKLFPNVQKRKPRFRNFYPMAVTRNARIESTDLNSTFDRQLRDVEHGLLMARFNLNDHFSNFDSLSPFRDKPQRTYLYSGETARQVGVSGTNTAIMLSSDAARRGSERKNLIDGISNWFHYTGIAQGLSVENLTPRHFELCLISNDGSKHNICDVGFGCSQVLPVLTAGLNLFHGEVSGDRRVLVVQEPEIHLHPNAQAAMGSYFVNLASRGGQIFIETHSDNLVLRVARHVALGDIDPDDVAIFYVSDIGDNRVTSIRTTETGTFKPEFPEGFFPQRQSESLMLARAAMDRREGKQSELEFEYPEDNL